MSNKSSTYRQALVALRSHVRGEMRMLVDVAHELALHRLNSQSAEVCRTCRPSWRTLVAGIVGTFVNELVLRKQRMLERVDEALERLDDGSYGICGDCDAQIPEARLAAVPYADRCLRCESEYAWRKRLR